MTRPLKRLIDVVLAGTALVLLSPIIIGVALAVFIWEGRPILFRQPRPGLHGVPFELVKFRTMRNDVFDADGNLASSDKRTTRVGYLLRKTSVDELPELVNVLRGEMSLVGPRPLLMEYLPRYSPEQARRHEVRPGITGLAQVRGREMLEWEKRFELDVWYVDHWSLRLDLEIIRATIRQVLFGEDVAPLDTPDYYFMGSKAHDEGDAPRVGQKAATAPAAPDGVAPAAPDGGPDQGVRAD